MSYFVGLIKQILREMLKRKIRTLLALFGIIWGTISVVLLLALGEGFYTTSKNNMNGFVEGTLIFYTGITGKPFAGLAPGQKLHIKAEDAIQLKYEIPEIKAVSPLMLNRATVTYHKQVANADIQGVTADYAQIRHYQLEANGRFIDTLDLETNRAVIYIGPELKMTLFGKHNALGKKIFINQIPFTIIGVLTDMSNTGKWYDNTAIIPYTTFLQLWGNQDIDQFVVLPKDIQQSEVIKQKILAYLSTQFHFANDDESAIYVWDTTQVYAFFNWFFTTILIFLGFCGCMTLGVGGLSVANVMFLIVIERTPEIGLRMALGARPNHIMLQIMLEGGLIIAMGSALGFLISGSMIMFLQHIHLPKWLGHPIFSPLVLCITLAVLAFTAMLAGYFPARKAAKMQPIEALAF